VAFQRGSQLERQHRAFGRIALPITYTDNYLTVMPLESKTIVAAYGAPSILEQATALRIDGYNGTRSLPLGQAEKETGSNPALQAGNQ
jgi:Exo-beta-D-glucosaminidase Ig-fold domain